MNAQPLLSVIIPVYNAEDTIESCVNSILHQDYPHCEVILIDDGSKDNSGEICDRLSKLYSNIKVFHYDNSGAAEARNLGIERSNGEYISFIDSDDLVTSDYLSYLYSLISEFNADISVCSFEKVYVKSSKSITSYEHLLSGDNTLSSKEFRCSFSKIDAVKNLLYQRFFISAPWAMLSKRTLWDKIRFPKGRRAEDVATIYKLFCEADNISYGNKKQYLYMLRNTNTVFSTSSLLNPHYYENCLEMVDYISANLPDAINAAKSRLFSACFQILSETSKTNASAELISNIYQTVASLRIDILKDSNGKPRNRIAALLSCISISFLHCMLRLYYKFTYKRYFK